MLIDEFAEARATRGTFRRRSRNGGGFASLYAKLFGTGDRALAVLFRCPSEKRAGRNDQYPLLKLVWEEAGIEPRLGGYQQHIRRGALLLLPLIDVFLQGGTHDGHSSVSSPAGSRCLRNGDLDGRSVVISLPRCFFDDPALRDTVTE